MDITVRVAGNSGRITIHELKRALPTLEKLAKEPPLGTSVQTEEGERVEINPAEIEREIIFYRGLLQYDVSDSAYLYGRKPGMFLVGKKSYLASDLERI